MELQKSTIKKELESKFALVNTARNNFIAEADGSGGTGKIGIKDIALAKRNEYQKLDTEYQVLLQTEQAKLRNIDADLSLCSA